MATGEKIKKASLPSERSGSKEKIIKYTDKSEGQPELAIIFEDIKALMKPYVKGAIKERGEKSGLYALVSEKAVEIEGHKKEEVHFAGLLVQKGYVGFYFMPVYMVPGLRQVFKPELLKLLKGKSCFHIKKKNTVIIEQIKEALSLGYHLYEKQGWV
jgi:hypothetical protein